MSHNLDFTSAFLPMDQLFLLINNSIVTYNGIAILSPFREFH